MKSHRPGFNKWIDRIYSHAKRISKNNGNQSNDSRSEFKPKIS